MKGFFRYDINSCVACKACVAGCKLINHGTVPWRMLISDNEKGNPGLPVHNLSIACNHCEDPSCLKACPSKAYSIDKLTGAVILTEQKCLGCNYCFWNCPFDAPQYDKKRGSVQKCHFCNERVSDGIDPACVSACPTGALTFSKGDNSQDRYGIIPDTKLKPRISFVRPKVSVSEGRQSSGIAESKVKPASEWTLLIFSFLTSLLFGLTFYSRVHLTSAETSIHIALSLLVLSIPLLHLGHPFRAWRALMNIGFSPLSFEIVSLLTFVIFSGLSVWLRTPLLWTLSFLSGLVLLVAIDNVYTSSDRRTCIRYHPGQLFLTGLMFASLFGDQPNALMFIAIVKIALNIWVKFIKLPAVSNITVGLLYIVIIVIGILLQYLSSDKSSAILLIIIAEFVGRIGFYLDFNPPGLKNEFIHRGIDHEEKR